MDTVGNDVDTDNPLNVAMVVALVHSTPFRGNPGDKWNGIDISNLTRSFPNWQFHKFPK